MKRAALWVMSVGLGALAVFPAACSSGDSSEGSGGGNSTASGVAASTTSGPTASVVASSSSGSGNMGMGACDAPAMSPSNGSCVTVPTVECGDVGAQGDGAACANFAPAASGECGGCVESSCCADLTACNGIPNCLGCVFGEIQDEATCGVQAIQDAAKKVVHCAECKCQTECQMPRPCNPVTNEPCDGAAGEACDFGNGGFQCYPAPNDQKICEECDAANGPWCQGGMTCGEDGFCGKYCCNDGDCGSGACQLFDGATVGICVKK